MGEGLVVLHTLIIDGVRDMENFSGGNVRGRDGSSRKFSGFFGLGLLGHGLFGPRAFES